MKRFLLFSVVAAGTLGCVSCTHEPLKAEGGQTGGRLTASIIPSGFKESHDSYNAISTASDGKI